MRRDFHVHTTFCDGKNTPEEIILSAISMKMDKIGFSGHSYTFFDEEYCMKKDDIEKYTAEISYLKKKYDAKIEILCGIEQDFYSDMKTDGFDYVIGSVHYIKTCDEYFSVDNNVETLMYALKKYYDGDIYALCEDYFDTVSKIPEKINADIIGHFDIVSKFNEKHNLFDEDNPRYVSAYRTAVDKLIKYDIPFEINTGAISRGYKTLAYPAPKIIDYIKEKGGKFILSSDSHSKSTLCFEFEKYAQLAKEKELELINF